MKVTKTATAGTLESSDLLVSVKPASGITIKVESDVIEQYGNNIKNIVNDKLEELNIKDVSIKIQDKGALDYAIIARLETALKRASS